MAETHEPDALAGFSEATRQWFAGAFAAPTPAQVGAWQAVREDEHALVVAPTGSGKTLAAFLWALDRLATEPPPEALERRCRVLYVSPLKALAIDVRRNLRSPLTGIRHAAHRLGREVPEVAVGMRTGDTPASERRAFGRKPPDILVTTPESLFLLLSSAASEALRGVETVILDEVHAVAGTKRGSHLAVSLERLDAMLARPAKRIGLSATVRPVDEVSSFLAGGRPVRVVNPEHAKSVRLAVEVPVPDMSNPESTPPGAEPPEEDDELEAELTSRRPSIWPAVEQRVYELVRTHGSTIVFANSRRLAERLTARLNELAGVADEEDGERKYGGDLTAFTRFPAKSIGESGLAVSRPDESGLIAMAHHGSMSREQRTHVEQRLKSGTLPCVVATSSLELGIDMGAVDLVVQVEAPPTVASGLQRIGRAGHHVGAVSEGVMFPKYRGDLVSAAVTSERMTAGAIEELRYPRNPLDVLAQHVVSMVAMRPCTVDELATLVRRSAPFAGLPDSALHGVLDMLAGRYPSEEFGELRPRITWDRITGELAGRPGAQRLAVTSGGTIPDRGLFTVMTPAGEEGSGGRRASGRRVGELDEEMVYESRPGDAIMLGTTSWRITDITRDQVIVVPAPGEPARLPFWKGDAPGRPLELGRAIGAFLREMSELGREAARERAADAGLDEWATDNLLDYLAEQRATTGHLPDDRTIVVERFRDELGDWRMIVHSPFGAKVNAPWALAVGARVREKFGIDAQVMSSDDGIVLRLADAVTDAGEEVTVAVEDVLLDPGEVSAVVTDELGGSALFAARFRECAARSLLLPRRDPGRRTPLWQQRQRSAQLLAVAAKFEGFPVTLEAMRECLRDVYDIGGLRELMSQVQNRSVRVVEVRTPSPSPFARSLLFGYVGMFLYEADAPVAERRAAALSLDSSLLAELMGAEAIRELLDSDVLAEVERSLQRLTPQRRARHAEDAADLLRFLGPLTTGEAAERGVEPEWLAELESARRAIRVRIAGVEYWIAIEDAGRVRDALGVALPVGLPEAFTEPVADPLSDLLLRHARTHGPFPASEVAHRFGLGVAVVEGVLERMAATGTVVRGELRPHGSGVEYCDAEVLRRLRRASLARVRAEVEPVEQAALGRFLPVWHGITDTARGTRPHATVEDVLAVVDQLAGAPVPASALESLVLPARLPGYSPALLDELTATGEVTWTGCGALAGGDGWVAVAATDSADLLLPRPSAERPDTPLHRAILSALDGGALFFRQLSERVAADLSEAGEPAATDDAATAALWDLVWAGVLTNDTLAPLRVVLSGRGAAHKPRRQAPRGRYARVGSRPAMPSRRGPATAAGRWSLVSHVVGEEPVEQTRAAHARAEVLLQRHGVLTRGALEAERSEGGFAAVYKVLRAMEESGKVVRGYVVEGLGAAQFAARGAVDRLRALAGEADEDHVPEAVVLAAADPAQPYGAALPWPDPPGETGHRPARKAGAIVALVSGRPALYLERGGRSLLSFTAGEETLTSAATGFARAVHDGRLAEIAVRRADGEDALTSPLAQVLVDAGFRRTPSGLRLRSGAAE